MYRVSLNEDSPKIEIYRVDKKTSKQIWYFTKSGLIKREDRRLRKSKWIHKREPNRLWFMTWKWAIGCLSDYLDRRIDSYKKSIEKLELIKNNVIGWSEEKNCINGSGIFINAENKPGTCRYCFYNDFVPSRKSTACDMIWVCKNCGRRVYAQKSDIKRDK